MIVRFVNIGEIDVHHCLNFLFIIVIDMSTRKLARKFNCDFNINKYEKQRNNVNNLKKAC